MNLTDWISEYISYATKEFTEHYIEIVKETKYKKTITMNKLLFTVNNKMLKRYNYEVIGTSNFKNRVIIYFVWISVNTKLVNRNDIWFGNL